MTTEQLERLFSPEFNLTPEARSLIAYVSTLGESEIPYDRLMRLLQVGDEKKLRRAIGEAEDSRWVTVERQTGRGHHPRFSFTPPENGSVSPNPENFTLTEIGTLSDRVPENGSVNGYKVPENGGVNCAPSSPPTTTTPPSPPENARTRALPAETDTARLRTYLGGHSRAVDLMLHSADHTPTWAAAVWGKYAPGGTQERVFKGIDETRRPAVLADAIAEFATRGKTYDNRLFDGFVRKSIESERRGSPSSGRRDPDGPPAPPRGAKKPDRFEHLVVNGSGNPNNREAV